MGIHAMAPAGAEWKGHTTTATHRDETLADAKRILDAFDERSTNDSRLLAKAPAQMRPRRLTRPPHLQRRRRLPLPNSIRWSMPLSEQRVVASVRSRPSQDRVSPRPDDSQLARAVVKPKREAQSSCAASGWKAADVGAVALDAPGTNERALTFIRSETRSATRQHM